MAATTQGRLHDLCSQALAEKDPNELVILLTEINEILAGMLSEVSQVLRAQQYLT